MGAEGKIFFSVVVPVYNQWHLIPSLLERLAYQSLPQTAFEVLLVDNGSDVFDPPRTLPSNVHLHACATPGSYAARNVGIRHSKGEWLVFTDADCLPKVSWLQSIMTAAVNAKESPVVIAGPIEMVVGGGQLNPYQIYDVVKGIPQRWYVSRGYAATANLAAPATLVRMMRGFDGRLFSGGDADFCRRAARVGASLKYVEAAVVEHPARDSWHAIATKARRIKGAHLTSGTYASRCVWFIRTLLPPFIAFWRFWRTSSHPMRFRATAAMVQVRLWGVEVWEAVRLLASIDPERR